MKKAALAVLAFVIVMSCACTKSLSPRFESSAKNALLATESVERTTGDARLVADARLLDAERAVREAKSMAHGEQEEYIAKLLDRYFNTVSHQRTMHRLVLEAASVGAATSDKDAFETFDIATGEACHSELKGILMDDSDRTGKCDAAFRAQIDSIVPSRAK